MNQRPEAAAVMAHAGEEAIMSTRKQSMVAAAVAALAALAGSAAAQPVNDTCSGATVIVEDQFVNGTTSGATPSTFFTSCGGGFPTEDVWYRYTPAASSVVAMDMCGSSFNTVLAVYSGGCGNLTEVACNDDADDFCIPNRSNSYLEVAVTAGRTYYVRVTGFDGAAGVFNLRITQRSLTNESCATAEPIAVGSTAIGNTTRAAPSGVPSSCGLATTSPDVWYQFVAASSGPTGFDLCGSGYDTVLTVYTGTCGHLVETACNDDAPEHCASDTRNSYVVVNATAGEVYYVRVTGYNGAAGAYTLRVDQGQACRTAAPIVENVTVTGDTSRARPSGLAVSCAVAANSPDVWYQYVPACTGRAAIDLCGSGYDTVVVLYAGTCDSLSEVACNDDALAHCPSNHFSSYLEADVAAGQTYYVRVSGYNGASGAYNLRIAGVAPANAPCAAIPVPLNQEYRGSTCLLTPGPRPSCANSNYPAWLKVTATCTGTLKLDTCGSEMTDTVLAVYTGDCASPTQIACNDDAGPAGPCPNSTTSYLALPVTAGSSYMIRVAGYGGTYGGFRFHAYYLANDTCASAAPINGQDTPFSTVCAAPDGRVSCDAGTTSPAVWFSYTATCNGSLVADTCGATFPAVLAVYTGVGVGGCGNLTELACGADSRLGPCPADRQAFLTAPVQAGASYLIRVSGRNGGTGTGTLHVSCRPPCPADFTGDFLLNVQDYLAFLNLYAAGDPRADMNASGTVNLLDYLEFLRQYAAGCPQ
jgi:hypothetical protein